jgi:hypothetical protein
LTEPEELASSRPLAVIAAQAWIPSCVLA